MKKSEKIVLLIQEVREKLTASIKEEVHRLGEIYMKEYEDAEEFNGMIEIPNPIIHQYIDDQTNEVICRINTDLSTVQIDTGFDSYDLNIEEIENSKLLAILEQLENIKEASEIELI